MTDVISESSSDANVSNSESLTEIPNIVDLKGQMIDDMKGILSKRSKGSDSTKEEPQELKDREQNSSEISPEQKEAPIPYQAFKARLAKEKQKRLDIERKYQSETAELKKAVEILMKQTEELRTGRYSLDPKDEQIRAYQLEREIKEFQESNAKQLEARMQEQIEQEEVEELKATLISDAQDAAKGFKLVSAREILKVMAHDPSLDAISAAKAIDKYKRSLYETSKPPAPTADARSVPHKAAQFTTNRGVNRDEMSSFMAARLNGKI